MNEKVADERKTQCLGFATELTENFTSSLQMNCTYCVSSLLKGSWSVWKLSCWSHTYIPTPLERAFSAVNRAGPHGNHGFVRLYFWRHESVCEQVFVTRRQFSRQEGGIGSENFRPETVYKKIAYSSFADRHWSSHTDKVLLRRLLQQPLGLACVSTPS